LILQYYLPGVTIALAAHYKLTLVVVYKLGERVPVSVPVSPGSKLFG
jgi:hypothetical protein